jgi:hypothetical protein
VLDRPTIRCVLFQGIVNAVLVVVAHVITNQPPEMLLVQRDHMVKDLAPAIPDPSFRDSILPGCLDARSLRLQTRRFQESEDIGVEFRVAVEDDIAIRDCFGKRFTQLLDDPLRRVPSNVEVQNLPTSVVDDEEAVQRFKGHRRHGEEVESDDHGDSGET